MSEDPDLAVNSESLGPVRDAARGLYEELPPKGLAAEPETLSSGHRLHSADLASGAALVTLAGRWRDKIQDLQADCATISGHLETTVVSHEELEVQIRDGLRAAGPAFPADAPANRTLLALSGIEPDPAGDA